MCHGLFIELIADIKKTNRKGWFFLGFLVGTRGFEPPTPCTPCKCATKLRHIPTPIIILQKNYKVHNLTIKEPIY